MPEERVTLPEILKEWLFERFDIIVDNRTANRSLSWNGYDICQFGIDGEFWICDYLYEREDINTFNAVDPHFFEKIEPQVINRIKYIRKQTDFTTPRFLKWLR